MLNFVIRLPCLSSSATCSSTYPASALPSGLLRRQGNTEWRITHLKRDPTGTDVHSVIRQLTRHTTSNHNDQLLVIIAALDSTAHDGIVGRS